MSAAPLGLAAGGSALWERITAEHELDAGGFAVLMQACRMQDRCDELALEVAEKGADSKAHDREQAASASLARLIAALRLPDEAGRRPQRRGVRGVQQPSKLGSAKDRLKAV